MNTVTQDGWNVSLKFDLATMTGDKDEIALRASYLKRNCFAAAFQTYFKVMVRALTFEYNFILIIQQTGGLVCFEYLESYFYSNFAGFFKLGTIK